MYSPREKGFSESLHFIDRCQVTLLREIAGLAGERMVLKGGMSMRASFGSLRLTKDMDFDRDPQTTTLASVKSMLTRGMKSAAEQSRLRNAAIDFPKATEITLRARLAGETIAGHPVRFEVEVSGRRFPSRTNRRMENVVPPSDYGMAPFPVHTYTHAMLAASKVLAVMSDNRNVPRDIYDLRDLILAQTSPVDILRELSPTALAQMRADVLGKLTLITFDQAREELLPYIPPTTASQIDRPTWEEWTLDVAESVEAWLEAAAS